MPPDLQRIAVPLITGRQCWDRVKDLAVELTRGEPEEPVSVFWIANGALFFAADLVREIAFRKKNLLVESVRGRSYNGMTTGQLKHDLGLIDLDQHRSRRVYVLDDCLDTGQTLHNICDAIRQRLAGSRVLPVAFVVKAGCQTYDVPLHAYGFSIHGKPWILGYGLDDDGYYRAEPGIWAKMINGWPQRAEDVTVQVGEESLQEWTESRRRRKEQERQ